VSGGLPSIHYRDEGESHHTCQGGRVEHMTVPRTSQNLFITPYEIKESPYKFGKVLDIYNGFSYITHLLKGEHFFLNLENDISEEDENFVNSYGQAYCSLHKRSHFKKLQKFRTCIFGGPSAFELKNNMEKIAVLDIPFEQYLNLKELSNSFDLYWKDRTFKEIANPKNHIIRFACSLGFGGCYWNNCIFCVYTYQNKYQEREDIEKILSAFPEETTYKYAIVFISINSIPLKQMRILIAHARELEEKNYQIQTFLRLDDELIDYLLSLDFSVNNITFRIGLESFSQKTVDILNKNFTMNTFLKSLKLIEKGFKLNYNLLRHFNFTDEQCYLEAKEVARQIPESERITFSFWENIHWRYYNRQTMEKHLQAYGGVKQEIPGTLRSHIIVPPKSAEYYNSKICEMYDRLPHMKIYFDKEQSPV
jgi:hypothetical protein